MIQYDLFSFEAKTDHRRSAEEEQYCSAPATPGRGRRCARCGRPLNGGGLPVAFVGLCCWDCYHKPMGRRDGRRDLSSDASGERNVGYNWRQ